MSASTEDGTYVLHKQFVRSIPSKKNTLNVPKKENKARREKQKREHLNELFLELDCVLEPDRQNNGKACILSDATRVLWDLIVQVESLSKDNTALLNESNYVTVERNELEDEKTALAADIQRLQNELQDRTQSEMSLRQKGEDMEPPLQTQPLNTMHLQQHTIGSLYFMPFDHDLLSHAETGLTLSSPNLPPDLMKPHARYPTATDSWPLELLSGKSAALEVQQNHSSIYCNSIVCSSRED